jgi:hypothetical protein
MSKGYIKVARPPSVFGPENACNSFVWLLEVRHGNKEMNQSVLQIALRSVSWRGFREPSRSVVSYARSASTESRVRRAPE